MSKTQTLTAFDPAGNEHNILTSGDYTLAGFARTGNSEWRYVAKGFSAESVRSRTVTLAHRGDEVAVVPLYDRAQLRVVRYFRQTEPEATGYGHITHFFQAGFGWSQTDRVSLDLATLKRLRRKGITSITVVKGKRTPDFTIDELIKPDTRPLLSGRLI